MRKYLVSFTLTCDDNIEDLNNKAKVNSIIREGFENIGGNVKDIMTSDVGPRSNYFQSDFAKLDLENQEV